MATDATGTASTNYSIPKYLTSSDKPSGKGLNAIVDFLDSLFASSGTLFGAVARTIVAKAGVSVGTRRKLNFIEGSNVTLTIADDNPGEKVDITIATTGGATEATTVAGLGAGSDGKIGRIRAGSTPFDFVEVVYDSTYAKWVSDEFQVMNLPSSSAVTSSADNNNWSIIQNSTSEAFRQPAVIPHKPFTDAGLTLQVRLMGYIVSDVGTLTIKVHGVPHNDADTAAGTDTSVTLYNAVSFTTGKWIDSGWTNLSPGTPKTMLVVNLGFAQSTNANTSGYLTLMGRWVA